MKDQEKVGANISPEQLENNINIYNTPGDINNTSGVSNNINIKPAKEYNRLDNFGGKRSELTDHLRSLGGQASQEARKRKRSFQEQARALLDMRCSRESAQNVLGDQAQEFFPEGSATNGEILLARMMLEGWQGNTKAAEFTRDTAGYKPTQEISVEGMDDAARALLANVAKRLEQADKKSKKD